MFLALSYGTSQLIALNSYVLTHPAFFVVQSFTLVASRPFISDASSAQAPITTAWLSFIGRTASASVLRFRSSKQCMRDNVSVKLSTARQYIRLGKVLGWFLYLLSLPLTLNP